MPDRSAMLGQLPSQVKSVNDALVEVCKVLTSSNAPGATPFNVDKVWGAAAEADIKAYVTGLTINADLTNAVKTLKNNSAGAAVVGGIDTVVGGLETVIDQILSKVQAAADSNTLDALQDLLKAHDPGTYGAAPFGLIPAISGIITAAGGNPAALTGPLNEIAEAGAIVQAMLAFADFADGTLLLLKKALNPA